MFNDHWCNNKIWDPWGGTCNLGKPQWCHFLKAPVLTKIPTPCTWNTKPLSHNAQQGIELRRTMKWEITQSKVSWAYPITQAPPVINITTGLGLSVSGGKYKSNLSVIVNGKYHWARSISKNHNTGYQTRKREGKNVKSWNPEQWTWQSKKI